MDINQNSDLEAGVRAKNERNLVDDREHQRVGAIGPHTAGLTRMSDVQPETVDWLWPGYLPLGKLTILEGDPNTGKSTLTLDLAARVTTGRAMPNDLPMEPVEPAGVVLWSVEDGLADTIRPRLDAAGADLDHVVHRNSIGERLVTFNDLNILEEDIVASSAKLVVIDPFVAFLPEGTNPNSDADVRRVLAGLVELAERLRVAIILVRHLRKQEATSAVYRGGGSIGFTAAARSVLVVGTVPNLPRQRAMAVVKSNLSAQASTLGYTLRSKGEVVVLEWGEALDISANGLVALQVPSRKRLSKVDQAVSFLAEFLSLDPTPHGVVIAAAAAYGITKPTLDRAKELLGVESTKMGMKQGWGWSLPDGVDPPP